MRIMDGNFSPNGISETGLKEPKLDQLFVWYVQGTFEKLRQIELAIKLSLGKTAESYNSN